MTFINIALSVILVAILLLLPIGCILTRSSQKARTSRRRISSVRRLAENSIGLARPHLNVRIAVVQRLFANETDRYFGRKGRDQAPARPNNQIGARRALAGIRKRMRWRAVLFERRLGF